MMAAPAGWGRPCGPGPASVLLGQHKACGLPRSVSHEWPLDLMKGPRWTSCVTQWSPSLPHSSQSHTLTSSSSAQKLPPMPFFEASLSSPWK